MKEKAIKILTHAMIVLFVSYYAESTLFLHSHTFDWGTVTHSHPYMPGSTHSHNSGECQTLNSLTNILFTVVAANAVAVMIVECRIFYGSQVHSVAKHIVTNCSLRAPPCLGFMN